MIPAPVSSLMSARVRAGPRFGGLSLEGLSLEDLSPGGPLLEAPPVSVPPEFRVVPIPGVGVMLGRGAGSDTGGRRDASAWTSARSDTRRRRDESAAAPTDTAAADTGRRSACLQYLAQEPCQRFPRRALPPRPPPILDAS